MPMITPARISPPIDSSPANSATGSAANPISEARKVSDLPLRKIIAAIVDRIAPRIQAKAIEPFTEIPIEDATT
jgi:hypothetical protein